MKEYSNNIEKISKIKQGHLSLTENVSGFLGRIKEKSHLNIFNSVYESDALKKAAEVELKIQSGSYGKLAGMVVAVKDVLSIKGKPLTCSSKMLEKYEAVYTSSAIQKLIDEDAIIIGKTNCDEFAMGSSNENSYFGRVVNPLDESRVPGGSSGGSAAAVAAELCDASIGTDTGGSIRQPAAFCGVYGLKPTYGRVSRFGLTAFASSFDSIGPLTNNIIDAALITEVISGADENDSTSSRRPVPPYPQLINSGYKPVIGIPYEYFGEGLSPEISDIIKSFISKLKSSGYSVVDINLPHTEYTIAAYYILTTAEASSNLARFDGARYGYRSENSSSLKEMYVNSRSEGFGTEVKRRIMLGSYVLSAGYYDAYYIKAQKVRRIIKNDFDEAFKSVDLILTPTSPTVAFKIGEKSNYPLQMYLSDIYTTSANLAGIPGLNVPGLTTKENLPVGLQLLAPQFEELRLFQFSYELEKSNLFGS